MMNFHCRSFGRFPAVFLAFVSVLASAACDGATEALSRAPLVTDSAGIQIVQHLPLERWDADVRLEELLRVGEADGADELLFSNIVGGLIRPDTSLVLADRGTHEVRRFAMDGTFLDRHGREGEGPGEYQYIRGSGRCVASGFTVFDIDWTMSVYDEAGEYVEQRRVRLEDGSSPYNMTCNRSGRFAVVNWDLTEGIPQGFHTSMARLRILNADGAELFELGERIGSERFGRPGGSAPHPAGRSTDFDFMGSDLIVADGTFFGFERWSADGRLEQIVRLDVPPPDPDSVMAVYLDATLATAPNDEARRRWRNDIEAMGRGPDQASFISALHVSADRILMRELVIGRIGGRWFEFRPDGTPVGYLPLPAGSRLLDVRDDLVLVEERGEFDVPMAVLYRLAPNG